MNMMVPPKTPPKTITQEAVKRVDEIGERAGFVNREPPPEPFRRTKPRLEPMQNVTMRLSIRSATKFGAWCERRRISYREGFDELVARIPDDE